MNLFDLLAEEGREEESQSKKVAKGAPSTNGPERELTPKERAAAKAAQEAERKSKREAEKVKQEAEAARLRLIELRDDTGFGQQRHQRIKESRTHIEPQKEETNTGKGRKDGNKGPKGPKGPKSPKKDEGGDLGTAKAEDTVVGSPKEGDNAWGTPKTSDKGDGKGFAKGGGGGFPKGERKPRGPGGEGGKGFKAPRVDGDGGRTPKHDFDRHSASVTSRQPFAKKGGHGVGNWGTEVSTPAPDQWAKSTEAEDAHVATADWGEATPTTEETTKAAGDAGEAATTTDTTSQKGKDKEDDKLLTLEEYQAIQEEKRKALEALFPTVQPRELSDEEKKSSRQV